MPCVCYANVHPQDKCTQKLLAATTSNWGYSFLPESVDLLMCYVPILSPHQFKVWLKTDFGIEGN